MASVTLSSGVAATTCTSCVTAPTSITISTSAGGGQSLTLDTGGVTLNGAGLLTLANGTGALTVTLNNDQTWTGANSMTVSCKVTGIRSVKDLVTINKTASGQKLGELAQKPYDAITKCIGQYEKALFNAILK